MYKKILFNSFLVLLLSAIQMSFVSGLPSYAGSLNLVLVALVFILAMLGFNVALWWGLGAGLVMDIISFSPFGIHMIGFIAMLVIVNFLLINFFTNRSLYSFVALIFFSTASFEIFLNLSSYVFRKLGGSEFVPYGKLFWFGEVAQVGMNIAAASLIFYLLNYLTDRMKPVFLK